MFPEDRMVEVKTFLGRGQRNDNHIPKCQWINLDAHPDGDSTAVIPRVNSYCMVFYVDGEPFCFGFFSPLTDTGTAFTGEEAEDLNEGDRVFKTIGGNKIILRAHGEIQIESNATCRTIYFPDNSLINTVCKNLEVLTDGGTIEWNNVDDQNNTYYKAEYRDNVSRANIIIVERGEVGGGLISSYAVGVGSKDGGLASTTYKQTIKKDGSMEFEVGTKGLHVTATPDGTTAITSGTTKINIAPGGAVTIETAGKLAIKAKDVEVDGGSGPLEKALTTPSAISDFTGLPIQQGSSSVKLSGA